MTTTLTIIDRDGTEKRIESADGASLMVAIRDAGVSNFGLCGGSCACASCHVYVEGQRGPELQPPSEDEDDLLTALSGRIETSRLSCQITASLVPAGCRVGDYLLLKSQNMTLSDSLEFMKQSFDYCYEAAGTTPLLFNFGTHPFVIGRADAAQIFREFLRYVKSRSGVWMTTLEGVANWWNEAYRNGYGVAG